MRYCIRDKTGILQVRGDSVDLTREGFPLLLLRLLSPPAILLVLYYAANNQSCGIVGDLAAGDAVTQLTRGFWATAFSRGLWGRAYPLPPSLFVVAALCCDWTGVEWRSIHPHLPRSLPSRAGNRSPRLLGRIALGDWLSFWQPNLNLPLSPFSWSRICLLWCVRRPATQSWLGSICFAFVRLQRLRSV
jgi:hypothetical protein